MIENDPQYLNVLKKKQKLEKLVQKDGVDEEYFGGWIEKFWWELLNYDVKVGATRRHGDWMPTYTKHRFWHLDPRPGDFYIEDVAHSLSRLCRWNGHVLSDWTVGDHSIAVSYLCKPENALFGLLHDLGEAYCGDLVTPVKRLLNDYKYIEDKILQAAALQFGFAMTPEAIADVKRADEIMLVTELQFIVPSQVLNLSINGHNLPDPLESMPFAHKNPWVTKGCFLARLEELYAKKSDQRLCI